MPNQKCSDLTEKTLHTMIKSLTALNRPEVRLAEQLCQFIPDLLSAEEKGGVTKPAGESTLSEVVVVFVLKYSIINSLDDIESHIWKIEDLKLDFTMTPCDPCLGKLPIPSFNSVID